MPDGTHYVRCTPGYTADLTFSFAGYGGALPPLRLRIFDAERWERRQARKQRKLVRRDGARKRRKHGAQS